MALTDFSLFATNGTAELVVRPKPIAATLVYPILDETPDGQVVRSGEGLVTWVFAADWRRAPDEADLEAWLAKRGADGTIRFRSIAEDGRTMQTYIGRMDPRPTAQHFNGKVIDLVLEFRRVVAG